MLITRTVKSSLGSLKETSTFPLWAVSPPLPNPGLAIHVTLPYISVSMNNFGPSTRAAKGHMPSMVPRVHSDVIIAFPELCPGGPVWVVVIVDVALREPQVAPGEG